MTFKECRLQIYKDRLRFEKDSTGKQVSLLVTSTFRIGNYLATKHNIFAKVVLCLFVLINFSLRLLTGIQLRIGTPILEGLKFPHWSCIVIAKSCVIGSYCTIHQGVTIGQTHFGKNKGYPTIGNNVLIYAGATISGNITIGNNVIIGSNAVITKDIPDNCMAVGHNKIVSTDCANLLGEEGRKLFWNYEEYK